MLETIIKHGIIFYAMGIMMLIGVCSKVISHITVRKMTVAASEIQKSNHRLMKLIKAKFEHASMVSDKVQNVGVFVKKYLYEYKIWGMKLSTWKGIHKKSVWLIGTFGGLGVIASYWIQGMNEQTFQYISWTSICIVLLCVMHVMSDERIKLDAAENYIVDYLENVCIHRYEKVNQAIQQVESLENQEEPEMKEEPVLPKDRAEQELRIRAIMEEFLA